jgi:phosphoglycolate phosphatase-like HAD superfamily hydrolase
MSKQALVVFDIDGTLLQTQLVTIPALQETFEEFALDVPDEADIRATFGVPVEEYEAWVAAHAPGRGAELIAAANARELELIGERGALYPGTLEVLSALRDAGHTLATCTNGSVPYADEALDAHNLRPYLALSRCIGHGYASKTAILRDIMDRLDARPAIVVGDRGGDIIAAHANGAFAIAAEYGFGSAEELKDADEQVSAMGEVPAAVERLLRGRSTA